MSADIGEQCEVAIFGNCGELVDANTGGHFVGVMAAGAVSGEQRLHMFFEQLGACLPIGVCWLCGGAVLCGGVLQQQAGEGECDAEVQAVAGCPGGGIFHGSGSSGGDAFCGQEIHVAGGLWTAGVAESRADCCPLVGRGGFECSGVGNWRKPSILSVGWGYLAS